MGNCFSSQSSRRNQGGNARSPQSKYNTAERPASTLQVPSSGISVSQNAYHTQLAPPSAANVKLPASHQSAQTAMLAGQIQLQAQFGPPKSFTAQQNTMQANVSVNGGGSTPAASISGSQPSISQPKVSSASLKHASRTDLTANTVVGQLVAKETNGMQNARSVSRSDLTASEPSLTIVRALFCFDGQTSDDLSFKKGDRMVLTREAHGDWWYARHLSTNREGYIPSNYVVIDDGKPQSQDCWFDVSRREADRHLLLPGIPRGTYLIRASSDPRHYALSVRDFDAVKNTWQVKHYKIRTLDGGRGYYISPKHTFPTFGALISHYEMQPDGLCSRLTQPCPRTYKPPLKFKDFEVNREAVQLLRKLGAGSFGEVWHAKLYNTVDVAVKTLKEGGTMPVDEFLKEAKIMHKLSHPKIVQLLGVCTASQPYYIITELMQHGALLDYLRQDKTHTVTMSNMIDMLAQICEGMEYLEAQNYIHRDLRAANVLVGENLVVKVADFGLAKFSLEDIYMVQENAKFPIKWTAPEAALERRFSVKSDVWSFGVVIYEVVTYGRTPYPGMSGKEVLEVLQRGVRMPRPEGDYINCPDALYQLMLTCWDARPDERPTFAYLKTFFDDFSVQSEGAYKADDAVSTCDDGSSRTDINFIGASMPPFGSQISGSEKHSAGSNPKAAGGQY